MMEGQPETLSQDKPGLLSGKLVLLVSCIILLLVVPTATWVTLRMVERDVKREPLVWADRASWQLLPVRYTTLDKSGFLQPPGDAPLRDTDFRLTPEAQSQVMAVAALMQQSSPDVASLKQMMNQLQDTPGAFYLRYLIARLAADSSQAETDMSLAFAQAPAALVLRFVDEQGQPKANWPVGTLTLMHAQIEDEVLDDSLQLVYRDLVTDERGRVYLPMFDAPVKLVDYVALPQNAGLEIAWPATEPWMTWPGQVGSPRPLVVSVSEQGE